MTDEPAIERVLISALIASDEFARRAVKFLKPDDFESRTAAMLAEWCLDYIAKYNAAPNNEIENIFEEKSSNLSNEQSDYISDILSGLSSEWGAKEHGLEYLIDSAKNMAEKRRIYDLSVKLKNISERGEAADAERAISKYQALSVEEEKHAIDPFSDRNAMLNAFSEQAEPLIILPKSAGEYLNRQFTRSSLVAFMGPEKRGKTFWLLELVMKGVINGKNVVFFQAGDMTEAQQMRRIGIYLKQKSDKQAYCGGRYVPEVDCWLNQTNKCRKNQRQCRIGILPDGMDQSEVKYDMLVEAYECNPEYEPCRSSNCEDMIGAAYLNWIEEVEPLTASEAVEAAEQFKTRHKGGLRLATYPNNTLSVETIDSELEQYERSENFKADIVVIDYADLLVLSDGYGNNEVFRHVQNKIWQGMRRLSQERDCLVITATQSSANSYLRDNITLKDFSEDKRKYAHVTAMYALNQTAEEKRIGILRIGELVIRDDEFDWKRQVKILQCLQRGRPLIGSYM